MANKCTLPLHPLTTGLTLQRSYWWPTFWEPARLSAEKGMKNFNLKYQLAHSLFSAYVPYLMKAVYRKKRNFSWIEQSLWVGAVLLRYTRALANNFFPLNRASLPSQPAVDACPMTKSYLPSSDLVIFFLTSLPPWTNALIIWLSRPIRWAIAAWSCYTRSELITDPDTFGIPETGYLIFAYAMTESCLYKFTTEIRRRSNNLNSFLPSYNFMYVAN